MEHDIFGYSWDDIQAAQQKLRPLQKVITTFAAPPLATAADIAMLAAIGAEEIKAQQLYGVLDRLTNSKLV